MEKHAEQHICEIASLTLNEAVQRMLLAVEVKPQIESVLIESALGRISAKTITAPIATPPFDNSAMDGYAILASDTQSHEQYECVGESYAGRPFSGSLAAGQCVRIMTGAMLAEGLDCVIPQEYARVEDKSVFFDLVAKPGLNVRYQGEDIALGSEIFTQGHCFKAVDLALLASMGLATVDVARRPSVAVLSTGDELIAPGQPLAPGQIYDSNRFMLRALLNNLPVDVQVYEVIKDDPDEIDRVLTEADREHDVILSTGGVSVGEADYMRDAFEKLGHIEFWKIKIKPGKPLAFGHLQNSVFLGLPGNPVSAAVCFEKFAVPLIYHMSGGKYSTPLIVEAIAQSDIRKKPGREEFLRGVLSQNNGENHVQVHSAQGSAILNTLSEANALVHLPADCDGIKAGDTVRCEWLPYLLQ